MRQPLRTGTAVFFAAERYLETKVLVQTVVEVPLEGWQMALCYIPPKEYETRTWEAVDVLLGGYSPAFKLHFYLISVVIIVALLNSIYGFAKIIRTGENKRRKEGACNADIYCIGLPRYVYLGVLHFILQDRRDHGIASLLSPYGSVLRAARRDDGNIRRLTHTREKAVLIRCSAHGHGCSRNSRNVHRLWWTLTAWPIIS